MKVVLIAFLFLLTISCGNNANENQNEKIDQPPNKEITEQIDDSLAMIAAKERDLIRSQYKAQGIIGKWKSSLAGFQGIYTLYLKGETFSMELNYDHPKRDNKVEIVTKKGDKYVFPGSSSGDYYFINSKENLEIGDDQGILTIAPNILFDQSENKITDLDALKGLNVFDVARTYSKSSPETLSGTDNHTWVVYYQDINVVFKVDKSTDKIISARLK